MLFIRVYRQSRTQCIPQCFASSTSGVRRKRRGGSFKVQKRSSAGRTPHWPSLFSPPRLVSPGHVASFSLPPPSLRRPLVHFSGHPTLVVLAVVALRPCVICRMREEQKNTYFRCQANTSCTMTGRGYRFFKNLRRKSMEGRFDRPGCCTALLILPTRLS